MTRKNTLLFFLSLFILFVYWLFSGEIYKEKFFDFQSINKKYDWGNIEINIYSTMQNEDNGIQVHGNPYGLAFNLYSNSYEGCDVELETFSLESENNNLIDIRNKQSDEKIVKAGITRESFYPGKVTIDDYAALKVSFKVNMICNNELLKTIEENEVLLKTQYSEKSNSYLDIVMGS